MERFVKVFIGFVAVLMVAMIRFYISVGVKMINNPESVGSWAAKILGPIINLVK